MITLEANYSKKLGLPGYSSHQFSVSLKTEIADLSKVHDESARLYSELQNAVDTSIQHVGFLPGENGTGSTSSNRHHQNGQNGNGNGKDTWNCSDKQRDLIIKMT